MKQTNKLLLAFIFILMSSFQSIYAQGKVYLVLGSDTAIWDGLDVTKNYCTFNISLYDDPQMNAYKVMDPKFREQFKDSYGQTMKMTWWMMAGNAFRLGTNKNIPVPNTITIYAMKKYHGEEVKALGDELSLHYHTFAWTDYNQDGKYFWNQAKNFSECKEDFDVTLAQFLLEENTFPVSFRSGWHYMGNEWQNYLDKLVPYCLHNDYPNVRTSIVEPIDNVYDWSKASKEFVPFHPSLSNYQLPGNGKSWNTRSRYMGSMTQELMDQIFAKAKNGVDQVPCLWAHLPEADFPDNMKRIDSLAHISAAKYPTVKFSYCTAVEAMQKWRKGQDTTAPVLDVIVAQSGSNVRFYIHTDENIFQAEPFVAVKDIYEQYFVVPCNNLSENHWSTSMEFPVSSIAKVGVAVTDTMGNLSTKFLNYLPDDIYIDNLDKMYDEVSGNWTTSSLRSWGTDSRQCTLGAKDSAKVNWKPGIQKSGLYNIWMQIPKTNNPAVKLTFKIFSNGRINETINLNGPFSENDWTYISTSQLDASADSYIQMIAYGKDQVGKILSADAMKFSALIKDKSLYIREKQLQLGPISEGDTATYSLQVQNQGRNDLTITSISTANENLISINELPIVINGMKSVNIFLKFYGNKSGEFNDTLVFKSNDSRNPIYTLPVKISVQTYFTIVDNEDSTFYSESGTWAKSVAQAWGPSSRFGILGQGAFASFKTVLKRKGIYEIFEIVPTTVNSTTNALYIIQVGTDSIGSCFIDQNKGSGNWVSLGQYNLPDSQQVEVKVMDVGTSIPSIVLRADAVKFQLLQPTSVSGDETNLEISDYQLFQNYPNPFNPKTNIQYSLPNTANVKVIIYNSLGQVIKQFYEKSQSPGQYKISFDGSGLSSGVYFYSIYVSGVNGKEFRNVKKMVLLK
ncbi:MAG: T9SS type A sorting domain-containing protein [Ignavibacteriales bacterium]|nr:T9SS type A sorting domain-containing protein [Ignavibacteriales bacterium]